MTPENFLTYSLRTHPEGARITQMLAAAVAAVDPFAAVSRHMRLEKHVLRIGERSYNLDNFDRVLLIGAGKAGAPMAQAAALTIGERLSRGIVIVKEGHLLEDDVSPRVALIEAGHPLPDERGLAGTRKIIELLQTAGERDLVVCMLSGGGSALLTAPIPGVSLPDLRALTDSLLYAGADIHEINTIRKHLSRVKGGQLARLAHPARLATLILSDVVGDNLEIIASGPTVPDPSTVQDARHVLAKYRIAAPHVFIETPKPGDPIFGETHNVLVGSNRTAAEAAAQAWGSDSKILRTDLTGEALDAGLWLAAQIPEMPPGACWIAGGETTVTLAQSSTGKGGRNQETALATVRALGEIQACMLITLATDGGDGPTEAAGAVVTPHSLGRALKAGLNPDDFLARHDSYSFFNSLGDLLTPGPTLTNVNDLNFLFRF